ncbi:MAG: outer membrane lipoprotein LolB [Succinivibrionaceae bacterium]|nr:outer membrane lipoprotein LolB [Succinivibrionaceae bacterium]
MWHKLKSSFLLGIVVALGGCQSLPDDNAPVTGPSLTAEQWSRQKAYLVDVQNYLSRGSMVLDLLPRTSYGSNTNTRGSASYVYSADGAGYVFAVTHSVAGMLLKIKRGSSGIELTDSDGNRHEFRTEQSFNDAVKIPVSRIPYWIMGVAMGDESVVRYDQEGRLNYAESMGWKIRYYEYANFGTLVMPRSLKLENSAVGSIVITVDEWEFRL